MINPFNLFCDQVIFSVHVALRNFRRQGLFFVLLFTAFPVAAGPMRVLVLNPFGRDVEPFSAAVSSFRSTLVREMGEPVDFHEIPLDLARFMGPEGDAPLVEFLEERIKSQPVDLVVPIGGAGAKFAAQHRQRLFPETPILAVGAEPRMIPPGFLDQNATLVTQRIDLTGMMEDMLQMQPATKQIAVVFGSSPLEKAWEEQCRREFAAYDGRMTFHWLTGLTLDETVKACASLPPDSFIFHGLFIVDAAGVQCEKNEALKRLHQSANAPVFACFASEFGMGSIGGRLFQNSEIGVRAAKTAREILRSTGGRAIPPLILEAGAPAYDWRELRRWNISEDALPAGSVIHFRQQGFWERYHWTVIGVLFVSLLQAALIIGLLVNRAKRKNREAEATLIAEISSKFVNLPAVDVDREIFDAQRRICELMDLDMAVLWQWSDRTPGTFTATHLFSLAHGPQPPVEMVDEDFPWVRQEILAGRVVSHRSLDDLPPNVKDRESARKVGIKSHLTLPLSLGGESPIGILGFNTTRSERDWPPQLIERLKLVAEIVANALARKRADHELREREAENRSTMQQSMELRDALSHSGRVTLLGQLASALAHELSQPLGAILRNSEAAQIMLQDPSPDWDEMRAIVDDILRDDQRAGQVIDKLRALLKKGKLDVQLIDLTEVIDEVLSLLKATAASRHVKLISQVTPGLPRIWGDRIHLQQVLLNLMVNAMDALGDQEERERVVWIKAGLVDHSMVEVRVCDNGPGIASENLGRLFESFFTTKTAGMGMGLPVSKTIIEAHKGTLWAENLAEGGACFCFTVPAAVAEKGGNVDL